MLSTSGTVPPQANMKLLKDSSLYKGLLGVHVSLEPTVFAAVAGMSFQDHGLFTKKYGAKLQEFGNIGADQTPLIS